MLNESMLTTFDSSSLFGTNGDNIGGNIGVRISGAKGIGGSKGRTLGVFGSRSGGGKDGSIFGGNEDLFEESRTKLLGFWLHRFGCLSGLNEKKPAENMWSPCFLDFR